MIDWISISLLILAGIGLVIVEIIFVPGTTVVGIMGFLMTGYGVYRSYELFGSDTGHIVLVSSVIVGMVSVVYSFKSNSWKKLTLQGSIDSKVNEDMTINLKNGQEGFTVSSLKPVGKAEFDNQEFEVTSLGNFIEENKPIRIIKIERNKVIVEPII